MVVCIDVSCAQIVALFAQVAVEALVKYTRKAISTRTNTRMRIMHSVRCSSACTSVLERTAELVQKNLDLQVVDMAVQASETAVMITDQKGCILWANNALAKLACTTLAQLRGKTFNDLFAFEESDDEQQQQQQQSQSQSQSRVQSPTAAAAAAAAIAAAQRSSSSSSSTEEPSAAPAAAALYSDHTKTLELRTQTWAGDSVVLQIEASHSLQLQCRLFSNDSYSS
eukprot:7035-Heterococcus_DN1.PRE.1